MDAHWPPSGGGGSGGVVNNAANVGTGVDVFQILSGSTLNFRTVLDGTGIAWTQLANEIRGDVTLAPFTTTNLSEGTNLYYTQARFDTAFAAKSTTNLTEGTNLYYTQARFDTAFAAKSTTNLAEGTNLYYTQARFDTAFAAKSTTNLSEGTNLYYTQARFDTAFAAKNTDNLTEGVTNLYFTQALARASVSGSAPVSYNSGTGVFSMHVADATHDGYLSAADFVTFSAATSLVTQGAPGLVASAGQLLGTNAVDDAANGYVGQHIISTADFTFTTNAVYEVANSIDFSTIAPGDFDVTYNARYNSNGANVSGSQIAEIGLSDSTTFTNNVESQTSSIFIEPFFFSGVNFRMLDLANVRVQWDGTDIWIEGVHMSGSVLKGLVYGDNITSGTPLWRTTMRARRVR